mgnify:CR=1 FL=1
MAKKEPKEKKMHDVYKATVLLRNVVLLVWATMIAHFVYVEFYKDLITIL